MFKENWGSRNIPYESTESGRGFRSFKRITWGAIFAGVAVAVVVQMILSLLGLGIGIGSINPTEANPMAGLGIGALVWWVASMLISLFCGGLVAGRLAGLPGKADSFLHGMLTWCAFTLLSFYLLTTTIGGLFNTVGNALSQGANMAGKGTITQKIPEAKDQIQEKIQGIDKEQAQQKAEQASQTASMVGIFGAIGLILGGIVASLGGLAGRPKHLVGASRTTATVPVKEHVYKH